MSFHEKINHQFYEKPSWVYLLVPFSIIFGMLLSFRKHCYQWKFFKTYKLKVPVVVVGNITLGGTGKTPLILHLAEELIKKKLRVGVISRGYKSSKKFPREVRVDSDFREVGDEPLLIKRRLNIPVFVGINRVKTGELLMQKNKVDIILSDDGLQYYALHRDYEFIVVDGVRKFGNKFLLPAGPLREPLRRLKTADSILLNSIKVKNKEYGLIQTHYSSLIKNIHTSKTKTLRSIKNIEIVVVTAIGNPDRFFDYLKSLNLKFDSIVFNDHHAFCQNDFNFYHDKLILMTEKDAVKCQTIKHDNIWYLPISVKIGSRIFNNMLMKIK